MKPVLPHEEIIELSKRVQRGDQRAFEKLVTSMAHQYKHMKIPFDDLFQEGSIGLMQAIQKYDWRKNVWFSEYAKWYIRGAMIKAMNEDSLIKLPRNVYNQYYKYRKAENQLEKELGHLPNVAEVAEYLALEEEEIVALQKLPFVTNSLSDKVDDTTTLGDFQGEETLDMEHEIRCEIVKGKLDELPVRLRVILRMRHGVDNRPQRTLEEVGEVVGVTYERVRQLELKAVNLMQSLNKRVNVEEV